jgi:hypothetical protein
MRNSIRFFTILFLVVFARLIATDHAAYAQAKPSAEITSPKHGDKVPRQGEDPPCNSGAGCTRIAVQGKVSKGYWPFLAVGPILAAPDIWIQPPVIGVRDDGTFDGMVYLGTERVGVGEKFTIFVFAHQDRNHYREGEILEKLPSNCIISEPVTVLRIK